MIAGEEDDEMADKPPRQYLEDVPTELQDLLYKGLKIEAIKLARQKTDLGLKEAKDKVEAVEAQMRARFPGALPEPRTLGCGTALLVLGIVAVLVAVVVLKASG